MGGGGADESVGPGAIDADEDNHDCVVLPLSHQRFGISGSVVGGEFEQVSLDRSIGISVRCEIVWGFLA